MPAPVVAVGVDGVAVVPQAVLPARLVLRVPRAQRLAPLPVVRQAAHREALLVVAALAAVAARAPDEIESLATAADRIERAARDLADALRQIAQQRRTPDLP